MHRFRYLPHALVFVFAGCSHPVASLPLQAGALAARACEGTAAEEYAQFLRAEQPGRANLQRAVTACNHFKTQRMCDLAIRQAEKGNLSLDPEQLGWLDDMVVVTRFADLDARWATVQVEALHQLQEAPAPERAAIACTTFLIGCERYWQEQLATHFDDAAIGYVRSCMAMEPRDRFRFCEALPQAMGRDVSDQTKARIDKELRPHLEKLCLREHDMASCVYGYQYYSTGSVVPRDEVMARRLKSAECIEDESPTCMALHRRAALYSPVVCGQPRQNPRTACLNDPFDPLACVAVAHFIDLNDEQAIQISRRVVAGCAAKEQRGEHCDLPNSFALSVDLSLAQEHNPCGLTARQPDSDGRCDSLAEEHPRGLTGLSFYTASRCDTAPDKSFGDYSLRTWSTELPCRDLD